MKKRHCHKKKTDGIKIFLLVAEGAQRSQRHAGIARPLCPPFPVSPGLMGNSELHLWWRRQQTSGPDRDVHWRWWPGETEDSVCVCVCELLCRDTGGVWGLFLFGMEAHSTVAHNCKMLQNQKRTTTNEKAHEQIRKPSNINSKQKG